MFLLIMVAGLRASVALAGSWDKWFTFSALLSPFPSLARELGLTTLQFSIVSEMSILDSLLSLSSFRFFSFYLNFSVESSCSSLLMPDSWFDLGLTLCRLSTWTEWLTGEESISFLMGDYVASKSLTSLLCTCFEFSSRYFFRSAK